MPGRILMSCPRPTLIFITENDQFSDGKPYPQDRTRGHGLRKTRPPFDDGEHILYVNGAYQGDSDIGRLMHDFRCCDAKDMYFKEMKEITHHFKETEEGVEYMCRAFEETRMEGELRGRIDTAIKLIKRGKLHAGRNCRAGQAFA